MSSRLVKTFYSRFALVNNSQEMPGVYRSLAVAPHLVVGWLPPLLLVKFPHIVVQIPMVWWSNPPIEVLKIRILAPKIFA
jgi:hypothetical protein